MTEYYIVISCIDSVLVFMDGIRLNAYILKISRTIIKLNLPLSLMLEKYDKLLKKVFFIVKAKPHDSQIYLLKFLFKKSIY